jgi:putative integral membrane protein (TIGR02587 family)
MANQSSAIHPINGGYGRLSIDLGRANAGAILFSFPLLMTMEMWWLGFAMNGYRFALFILLTVPLMFGLSYYDGFEDTQTISDDVRETFIAYFVGFVIAALMLYLFGVITSDMSADEIVGKVSLQAVVAGMGAMFTQSLLGPNSGIAQSSEKRKRSLHYGGQLFLTAVGALFLSMSVAPTEEMMLISYQMTDWQVLGLAVLTIAVMHGFIYAADQKRRKHQVVSESSWSSLFFRLTLVSYAIVLLISFYILWTFGSIDAMGFAEKLKITIVLGFPAAVGGGASRLII